MLPRKLKYLCNLTCSGRITCDLPPINFGVGAEDLGILEQSSDDEQDWRVINKKTPSAATGPSADHTSGVSGSGFYAFLEGSGIKIGNRVCGLTFISILIIIFSFFLSLLPCDCSFGNRTPCRVLFQSLLISY